MNQEKQNQFSETYRAQLKACAEEGLYEWPKENADAIATKMLNGLFTNPGGVNFDSPAFKRTCKALGIKHTRKAIVEFLGGAA